MSFAFRVTFGLFLIFAGGAHFTFVHPGIAQETKIVPRERVLSMLEAINKIRTRRDIELDCSEYVYRYLGRSDRLKHYIDLFAANGISPNTVRGPSSTFHVGFRIDYSHLKEVPDAKFGRLDIVAIVFIADGEGPDSLIHSCKAVLRAAPQHL
jgi:hypothetical protein